jgi:hypothetical protein
MDTANSNPQASTQSAGEPTGIPLYDRFVLWMFMLGFVLFGLILVGDLVVGFFR